MVSTRILSFTPDLATQEQLTSHCSTLEAYGKKLDEKLKTLRSADLLFSARKADWESVAELAQEIRANNEAFVVLSEGFPEATFRATRSLFTPRALDTSAFPVKLISSSRNCESLKRLGESLEGRKVSLLVAFHDEPSARLLWSFRLLLSHLGKDRDPEELKRRVFVATGEPTSDWERWAQKEAGFRTLAYPHRSAGRYLFFSEPNALLTELLGVPHWRCVEGGRSFLRQYDKMGELDDPIFAYAALREVQLTEHHRETLVLPDESFTGFAQWWRLMTEDTRAIFSEETFDGVVHTGRVMKEVLSPNRRHWLTELAFDSPANMETPALPGDTPCYPGRETGQWNEIEECYDAILGEQRALEGFSQPSIRIGLRRGDPFCMGGLMAFYESVVCTCHRLAEISEESTLAQPYNLDGALV